MFMLGGSYYLYLSSQTTTTETMIHKRRNGGGGSTTSGSVLVRRPPLEQEHENVVEKTTITKNDDTLKDKDTTPQPHGAKAKANAKIMPQWIREYVAWHHEMRFKYPGASLVTDPDSPGVLLRWCGGLCGGLHDRLGQLPLDLFVANQTRRVLLIKWEKPHPLEHFMEPPLHEQLSSSSENNDDEKLSQLSIDWTFPKDVPKWSYPKTSRPGAAGLLERTAVANKNIYYCKSLPSIANIGGNRGEVTLKGIVSEGIEKFSPGGTSGSEKVVLLKVMGHLEEDHLEDQLQTLGQTDMIHATSTFGLIWHMFFQLTTPIQKQLDQIIHIRNRNNNNNNNDEELEVPFLVTRQYTAVHCRVRHPKAFEAGTRVQGIPDGSGIDSTADKTGLPFDAGPLRDMAVKTAIHALKCAATQLSSPSSPAAQTNAEITRGSPQQQPAAARAVVNTNETYYLMSDSNDLVEFMVRDVLNDTYMAKHHPSVDLKGGENNNIYAQARQLATTLNIKARDNSASATTNAHIDKEKGKPLEDYYSVFVDLHLAMHARCLSFGIGFYAVFAAKIGGIVDCKVQYAKEKWGETPSSHGNKTNTGMSICTPDLYKGLF
jgi:hypothetical protein